MKRQITCFTVLFLLLLGTTLLYPEAACNAAPCTYTKHNNNAENAIELPQEQADIPSDQKQSAKTSCNSSSVSAEISIGELIDKITILEIKQDEIKSKEKFHNITMELESLRETCAQHVPPLPEIQELTRQLKLVNRTLWEIEDAIRLKEALHCFDEKFIELARAVYVTNDQRCAIKRQINDLLGSKFVEEKSYQDYLVS